MTRRSPGVAGGDDGARPLGPIAFDADVIAWCGPSPYVFAVVPARYVNAVRSTARAASYGWGVVPVEVAIDGVAFRTSLFPKDGGYLLPLRDAVRASANVAVGDTIAITMTVRDRA